MFWRLGERVQENPGLTLDGFNFATKNDSRFTLNGSLIYELSSSVWYRVAWWTVHSMNVQYALARQNWSVASEWTGHLEQRQQTPCAALFTAKLKQRNVKHYLPTKNMCIISPWLLGTMSQMLPLGCSTCACLFIWQKYSHKIKAKYMYLVSAEEDVYWDQYNANLLIQMLFMHPRVQCNIFKSNSVYWFDYKKGKPACFIPHIKEKSWRVPTNCIRLGLKFHLGKQKEIWYWSSSFLPNKIREKISDSRELWGVHRGSILH